MLWGGFRREPAHCACTLLHSSSFSVIIFCFVGIKSCCVFSGVQTGLQHVELADPPQEPELPASGLQLQLEAGEDTDHQGEEEVALRKRLPLVSRDPATHQTHRRCSRPIQTRQY